MIYNETKHYFLFIQSGTIFKLPLICRDSVSDNLLLIHKIPTQLVATSILMIYSRAYNFFYFEERRKYNRKIIVHNNQMGMRQAESSKLLF